MNKIRKSRIFALIVLVSVMFSTTTVNSFAGQKDIMTDIQELIKKFEDFSLGNTLREIKNATGYKDVYHVISGHGESVELTIDPLGAKIKKLLCKSDSDYSLKYQWYACNAYKKKPQKIDGATDKTVNTNPFNTTGLQYYYCSIRVYEKHGHKGKFIRSFKTPMYVVGYTGLPVVYVNTSDGTDIMSKEVWKEDATIYIVDGIEEKANIGESKTIKIKGRGNSTWKSSTKAGYTFKFDKKQDLFGIGEDKKWALVGNFSDRSLLRNWMASNFDKKFFNTNEEWNATHKHVELVLNNEYRGNFTLASTVKLGKNRINVPDISEKIKNDINRDGEKDFFDAGFVVEIDNREDSSHHFRTTKMNIPFSLSDPDLDDEADNNAEIFEHIRSIIQTTENAIYADNYKDPVNGYAKYIDVDSFVDWYLLEELSKNQDGRFNLSTYMYYQPADGKMHMASAWDFDITFGNTSEKDFQKPEGIECQCGWYARLFEDPAFKEKVNKKWESVSSDIKQYISDELIEQSQEIKISAKMNFIKWPELGMYIWPAANGWWMRWTYMSEVKFLQKWTLSRINWLDKNGF